MSQPMGHQRPTTREQTAEKLKERFEWLQSFTDDELREITYCIEGQPMKGDEQYFDISHPEQGVISGIEGQGIPEGSCYVPQSEIPRRLWEKLVSPFTQAH